FSVQRSTAGSLAGFSSHRKSSRMVTPWILSTVGTLGVSGSGSVAATAGHWVPDRHMTTKTMRDLTKETPPGYAQSDHKHARSVKNAISALVAWIRRRLTEAWEQSTTSWRARAQLRVPAHASTRSAPRATSKQTTGAGEIR